MSGERRPGACETTDVSVVDPDLPGAGAAADEHGGLGRSSLALTASAMVTGVVGLGYWIVMGRLYPAADVGAAAAIITSATILANFGNLGLGAYLERFLPVAGAQAWRLTRRGLLLGSGCGLLLGAGFLLVGPTEDMMLTGAQQLWFPLFVVVLSSFALLDHVSIAMARAPWAAGKNIAHSVVKLVGAAGIGLMIGELGGAELAGTSSGGAGRMGMVGTWIGAAALASLVVGGVLLRHLERRSRFADGLVYGLPGRREQLRFAVGNYGVYVVTALTPLVLPLIVVARVGAAENAYFAIVWSLMSAVLVLLTMLTGPFVSAASVPDADVAALVRRFGLILAAVAGAATIGFITAGPFVLGLAGPDYADAGGGVLRIAALALVPAAIGIAYTGLARVRRRMAPALAAQGVSATLMLVLCAYWLPRHGLVSAAWAILIAESLVAILVIVPLLRAGLGRGEPSGTGQPG